MRPDSGPPDDHAAFEAGWRERFAEFAAERDDDAGIAGWSRTGLDARMRRFSSLWDATRTGERWLDAGCGAGTYARGLHAQGIEVVGIDYSLPALVKARERCAPGIGLAVSDIRRLPFRPESFDGVLCFGVLQALGESEGAIDALCALVRPGGEIFVDALNGRFVVNASRHYWRAFKGRPSHLRYERPRAVPELLRARGFEDVRVHWMPIVPARFQRLQGIVERPAARTLMQRVPLLGTLASHAFIVHARKPRAAAARA